MRQTAAVIGFVALVGGCAWHYPPLGFVVAGIVLFGMALYGHFRGI